MNSIFAELNHFSPPTDFVVDELFDAFGSDAVTYDANDPAHNYWVPITEVAEEDLHPDFRTMIGADESPAERDARLFDDDPTDPPCHNGEGETEALVAKFSERKGSPRPVYYKGQLPTPKEGYVAVVRYDRDTRRHVLGRQAKVIVRKHRYVDGDGVCKDPAFLMMPKSLRAHLATLAL